MTMKRKSMLIGFGAALIACGVLVMAQVPWFFIRSEVERCRFTAKEQAALAVSSQGTPNAWTTPSSALPLADASQARTKFYLCQIPWRPFSDRHVLGH